jgi:hypothetical protein
MAQIKSIKEILTHEFLSDWLSTATYGSFWCECQTHVDTPDDVYEQAKENNECTEDVWADVLLNGGALNVVDVEEYEDDEDTAQHKVTLTDIENAIPMFAVNYPSQWGAIMDETMDLIDADALLQFVIFGELVYG